jgi:hypothetical protein
LFDASDVAGAAVEAAADVGVCGSVGAPFQDSALNWPQHIPCRRDVAAGHPRVCDDPIDVVRSAPETASDLDVINAVGDEPQDTAFDGPQQFVVSHVLVSSARCATLR